MLITSGTVAGSASGSAGGLTASRNRYGAYIRNRSVPVNPNSGRQAAARGRFATAAERWSGTLTQAQRDAWDLYGDNVTWLNALGQPIKLTGFNHYVRSVTAILAAGGTIVDDGPTVFSLPEADPTFDASASEAGQDIDITFDNTLAWANETGGHMLISQGQPKGAGRSFLGGPYRDTGAIDGDGTTPPTSPDAQTAAYGIAADQKMDVRARIIRADGRVSNPFLVPVTVGV